MRGRERSADESAYAGEVVIQRVVFLVALIAFHGVLGTFARADLWINANRLQAADVNALPGERCQRMEHKKDGDVIKCHSAGNPSRIDFRWADSHERATVCSLKLWYYNGSPPIGVRDYIIADHAALQAQSPCTVRGMNTNTVRLLASGGPAPKPTPPPNPADNLHVNVSDIGKRSARFSLNIDRVGFPPLELWFMYSYRRTDVASAQHGCKHGTTVQAHGSGVWSATAANLLPDHTYYLRSCAIHQKSGANYYSHVFTFNTLPLSPPHISFEQSDRISGGREYMLMFVADLKGQPGRFHMQWSDNPHLSGAHTAGQQHIAAKNGFVPISVRIPASSLPPSSVRIYVRGFLKTDDGEAETSVGNFTVKP